MPKINTKLASQGLTPQSTGPAQLNPVMMSPNSGMISTAGGRITSKFRAPSVNPNAGNIKYTPLKPNDIVVNPAIDAFSQMAQQWSQSAFNLQERQAQADADGIVAAYRQELKSQEIGHENENGEWVNGYLYSEGKEATEGFDGHRGMLDSRMEELLAGVSPTVREKSVVRLANERGAAQNRAAQHNAKQFKVVEQQVRYDADQQALDTAKNYGPSYFQDGRFEEHLDKYYSDDPQARDAAAEFVTQNAMNETYNEHTRNPDFSPMQAYQAAQNVYEAGKDHMSEEKQTALDGWLVGKLEQARNKERTNNKENLALAQAQALQSNPVILSDYAKAGNWEGFFAQWETAKGTFADKTPLQQIAAQTKMMQGTVDAFVASGQFTDILDKTEAATEVLNMMMRDGGVDNFDPMVAGQVMSYVYDELPAKLVKQQKAKDTMSTFGLSAHIAKFDGQGVPPYTPPPQGMLPDAAEKWDKAQETHANQMIQGLSPEQFATHANVNVAYQGELVIRPMTKEQLEGAWDMVATGDMAMKDYFAIAAKSQQLKDPLTEKPAYKQVTEFTNGTTQLEVLADQGIFDGGLEEPEADDPEYGMWKVEHAKNKGEAMLSWDKYAATEYAAGRMPQYREWYAPYMVEKNKGHKISNNMLENRAKIQAKQIKDMIKAEAKAKDDNRKAQLIKVRREAAKEKRDASLERIRNKLNPGRQQPVEEPPMATGH